MDRAARSVVVGARCEVRVPQQGARRGVVRYNGALQGAKGLVNGERYFTCLPKYGGFVKPVYVTVGDFPEEELDLEDEI
ncbi:Tubulin folding cofactor B [Operophtera brumata]|uniref:Tubulin folding cofactor B n=1 Tax=Operophtera brumata TaxID=104452 RepID=A0A0L7KXF8_OPEBR|nr:Tubulin folding cofactor B [Operophtera brumata]